MEDKVLQQQEAVRRSGKTNMLDVAAVQSIAYDADFHQLVSWIEEHTHSEYVDMASRAAEKYRDEDIDYQV